MATSIDPSQVQWDDIDPTKVQWDAQQSNAPTQYQTTTPYDAQLGATSPVTAEIKQGLGNAAIEIGARYTDVSQRMHQLYNFITGGPSMDAEIQQKRAIDSQINNTYGGKIGAAVAFAPGALLAGTGVAGNALYGGVIGALQPTTSQDNFHVPYTNINLPVGNVGGTAINTGVGAAIAGGASKLGNSLSNWAPNRATQPVAGWTPESSTEALTTGVGLKAPNFANGGLGLRNKQLGAIFQQGRNAATSIDLSGTEETLGQLTAELNPSVRALVESNPNVADLMEHVTGAGVTNGQKLGNISTGLRQDAYTALNSEGGNREVGLALQSIREHAENLIQSNIPDPAMRAAYGVARPQYGLLQDIRYNPSIVDPDSGIANMKSLGNFLQRNNPAYTEPGAKANPVFNAAMWGRSAGAAAKGSPKFTLASPWDKPVYWATENPISRGVGGVASRALAPVAPALPYGLSGLGIGTVPIALPYLEQ